jgi:microcystin-dependent protein
MANPAKILERGTDGVAFEALIPASQPGDVFPAGTVVDYAGSAPPTGWLVCDGSVVSRATYPTLFANIGTTFGAGDGSTTFGIPDCRGKVIAGKHSSGTFQTLGGTGGEETHALSNSEMPSHSHGGATQGNTATTDAQGSHQHSIPNRAVANGSTGYASGAFFPGQIMLNGANSELTSVGGSHSHNVSNHAHAISADGGGGSHNNLQPYIVLNKIIRAY